MKDVLKFGKKLFTFSVVAMTLAWSLGLSMVAPLVANAEGECPAVEAGDLVKVAGKATVYVISSDLKRQVIPDEKVFYTWYKDFSSVKIIAETCLSQFPLTPYYLTFRPGSMLVKSAEAASVYAVLPGGELAHIANEQVAAALYGANWFKSAVLAVVPDTKLASYPDNGKKVSSAMPHDGMLLKRAENTQIFYVTGGKLVNVEGALSKVTSGAVRTVSEAVISTLGLGVSSVTEANILTQGAVTTTPVVLGNLTVSLSASTPSSKTLVAGQAIAHLTSFNLKNESSSEMKVTSIKLKRIGVSADTTLSSVYLYQGMKRLTDNSTVSSGFISFNDSTGIVTVPAYSTVTVDVKSNITSATSGQTVGVSIESSSDVKATNASIGGSFPVSGNLHSIATATLADFNMSSTVTPATTDVDSQSDYVMFQNSVSITERDVYLRSVRFRQIGSMSKSDLSNFRLYVEGVQVGSIVSSVDENNYLVFDLSSSPVLMKTGTRIIKLLGDVVDGSSRTFSFSIRQASDVEVTDSQYGVNVLARANSTSFSALTTGTQTIASGTLTITKMSDSPSGNVINGATNVKLAKFQVKANGEKVKVENLRVYVDESDSDTALTLRNGMIYANGVQIGNTASLAALDDATLGYTEYNLGSALVVEPGTPVVLEVYADIYDNDGANEVAVGDTLRVYLDTGSSNAQRMVSLNYFNAPTADLGANTLTVAEGSLTVAKNTSLNNHTAVAAKTAYKVGSFKVVGNTTEDVSVTSVVVDFTATDAADASSDLTNLYFTFGDKTSSIKSTVTDTNNTWSVNYTVKAGETVTVDVYADVATTVTDAAGAADTLYTNLQIVGTGVTSSSSIDQNADGQTTTWGTGSFVTALDGSSPLNRIVAANQEVEAANYKFTATNETYTVKEVQVKLASAAVATAVSEAKFYSGTTLLGSASFSLSSNTAAKLTGMSLEVPANSSKVITVKLVLNNVGTGMGTSQVNAALTLDSVLFEDTQGVQDTSATDRAGNEMYVYKSVPTVASVNLDNSSNIVNGQPMDLYKFTVTAGTNDVRLKQFVLPATLTDGGTGTDTLEVESLKLYENGVDISSYVVLQDQAGNSVESTSGLLEADDHLVISWAAGYEGSITAGATKTYTIRGTLAGFNTTDSDANPTDSFSLYFPGDSAHNSTKVYLNGTATAVTIWGLHTAAAVTGSGTLYNFIWSDANSTSHVADENATSTGDWMNSYKVLNLDLDGETWSN